MVLTRSEAVSRAALLDVESYDVFLDLTAAPARSRTEVRFRCRTPGADTFADAGMPVVHGAMLNGIELGPAVGGRLPLRSLAAENVLVVDAELAGDAFERHTDPADGAAYLHFSGFPSQTGQVIACFDQPDLGARFTLTLRAPAGWEVFASGAVVSRPPAGEAGDWRFAPVPGLEPYLMLICAGPFVTGVRTGAGPVRLSVSRRASLDGADGIGALGRFGELARDSLDRYASMFGVPCPDPKYDLGYARIRFDARSFEALSAVAMDVGDPLTESVCWNAAWQLVTSAELPAGELVELIVRRLGGDGLPVAALETLTGRAVRCADVWAPAADRARLRSAIADAVAGERAGAGAPERRVLAGAFAASAQTAAQLDLLRERLGAVADADLRAKITFALAARGLAADADIEAVASLDPVGGALNAATGRAMRPDLAAKDAAWRAALDPATGWQLAQAHATGIWVPGQEELMAGYRDRYFGAALAALASADMPSWMRRRLASQLYPATLCDAATVEASAAVDGLYGSYREDCALVVAQQTAIMRSVLAARTA